MLEKKNDFLVLQEWIESLRIAENKHIVTESTFTLPLKRVKTGTATISSYSPISSKSFISKSRELGCITPKSALITTYDLNGRTFTVGNCHALNFVSNAVWKRMIDSWAQDIPKDGSCIVAGDFNTWNPWRFDHLEKKLQDLGFKYAHYDHNLVMRLDHIWCRDVEIVSCAINMNVHTSDHYPVTIKFKL